MKNLRLINLACIVIVGAWFLACSDETINSDRTGVAPASIFYNDSARISNIVNDIYSHLPSGWGRLSGASMVACATDEAVHAVPNTEAQLWGEGSWNPSTLRDNTITVCYRGIRRTFLFEEEIYPYIPDIVVTQTGRRWFMSQVVFLRAYLNFELLKRFGGYPIVNHFLSVEDDLDIPRSTYDECVEYIVGLCDDAARELPLAHPNTQFGRATRGAALALKARVLLYAASPLFNDPSKPNDALEHGAYSAAKWGRAVEAAAAVINLKNDNGTPVYALFPEYDAFFNTLERANVINPEIIISRMEAANNALETQNGPSGYTSGQGGACPTWDMVCAYDMIDGTPFDWNNPAHAANPFEGRDPRFEMSILYNGADWMQGRKVETFEGGLDRLGERATPTSFYLRKFLSVTAQWYGTTGTALHCFPLIRYAEILLNYAEAMNEANGPDNPGTYGITARQAVELIRVRAGLTGNIDLLETVPVNDQSAMREAIRRERRVELAFEEHRHLDVRRWKIAETVLNRPVSGLRIERNGENFIYTPQTVQNRVFDASKMYLYPFPQTEIARNGNLVQNANW